MLYHTLRLQTVVYPPVLLRIYRSLAQTGLVEYQAFFGLPGERFSDERSSAPESVTLAGVS